MSLDGYQVPDLLKHIDENKEYTIAECSVSDPYHFDLDPDPDPRIRIRDHGS